jgi:hypothetical protein
MSNKRTATAALLLTLMPAMPALPQAEIDPDHFPDPPDAPVSMVKTEGSQQADARSAELQSQENLAEETRQEAISAGIQGDGAASYISEYRNQVNEVDTLRAKLNMGKRVLTTERL